MTINRMITITGKVQGVFYRGSAREQSERLGVNGEVKNMPDGSVVLIAEGEEEAVKALIAWCHYGPPRAEVQEVAVKEGVIKGYKDFKVIRF
ncbi:acylphosphatase [Agriterribacter sp.]|uniref:acylphosphatase n=1 Tax=Agriterribacter sp. TaxID=2821509 RepID=UPI002CD9C2F8|nr:acylphosphatase [Agriterribacter sp.]HRO46820.1 acylphosphatase [Agriterribacter sp.]HRQ15571.1 acylphosphatase [Agriterribacter sp.]